MIKNSLKTPPNHEFSLIDLSTYDSSNKQLESISYTIEFEG